MFLTHKHAQIDTLNLFGEEPFVWKAVEHTLHRPWFYVTTSESQEAFQVRPMLLLSDERSLQALVSMKGIGLRAEGVLIVTPDHLNHSGRWMMEPLEEIELIEGKQSTALTYKVEGGRTYTYGDREITSQKALRKETLFSRSMLAEPAS